MAKSWRGLTQIQRDAWDIWAAAPAQEKFNSLGQSYFASGFNWYVAINDRLLNISRGARVNPPVIARPAAPTLSDMQIAHTGAGWDSYVQYPGNEFLGFDLVLFIAMANSEGVLNKTQGWRLVHQTQAPAVILETFQTGLEAAFGTIQVFQRGFCRLARQTTDGVRSAFATMYDDVS
jgi:superoxide dismutase